MNNIKDYVEICDYYLDNARMAIQVLAEKLTEILKAFIPDIIFKIGDYESEYCIIFRSSQIDKEWEACGTDLENLENFVRNKIPLDILLDYWFDPQDFYFVSPHVYLMPEEATRLKEFLGEMKEDE
jgi:hypothetical protein